MFVLWIMLILSGIFLGTFTMISVIGTLSALMEERGGGGIIITFFVFLLMFFLSLIGVCVG